MIFGWLSDWLSGKGKPQAASGTKDQDEATIIANSIAKAKEGEGATESTDSALSVVDGDGSPVAELEEVVDIVEHEVTGQYAYPEVHQNLINQIRQAIDFDWERTFFLASKKERLHMSSQELEEKTSALKAFKERHYQRLLEKLCQPHSAACHRILERLARVKVGDRNNYEVYTAILKSQLKPLNDMYLAKEVDPSRDVVAKMMHFILHRMMRMENRKNRPKGTQYHPGARLVKVWLLLQQGDFYQAHSYLEKLMKMKLAPHYEKEKKKLYEVTTFVLEKNKKERQTSRLAELSELQARMQEKHGQLDHIQQRIASREKQQTEAKRSVPPSAHYNADAHGWQIVSSKKSRPSQAGIYHKSNRPEPKSQHQANSAAPVAKRR